MRISNSFPMYGQRAGLSRCNTALGTCVLYALLSIHRFLFFVYLWDFTTFLWLS